MTLNDELLEKTMAHIEAHPHSYNGEFWRQGDTMDFAGHAAILAGAEWISTVDDKESIRLPQCGDSKSVDVFRSSVVRTPSGQLMHVADFAAAELLIDDHVEDALFSDASVAELRVLVDRLVDPTPVTQEEVTAP